MSISTYLANKWLDHAFRNTAYTPPSNIYLSLHSGDPGDSGASELSGGGYGRSQTAFDAAASRATANTSDELFTSSSGAWSTASYWGLWDASTSGNFLWGGSLTTAKTAQGTGDIIKVLAGELDLSITGHMSTYLANKLLDLVLRGTAYTPPAAAYLGLNSGDPGLTGASEIAVANGYARSSTAFDAAASKVTQNSAAEVFTNTGSAWSATPYFSLWDASSAGNNLWGDALTGGGRTVGAGETGTTAIGALVLAIG